MSQHLDFPRRISPQLLQLPHDLTHAGLHTRRTPVPARLSVAAHGAAWLLALPIAVASLAGVALAIAPLA